MNLLREQSDIQPREAPEPALSRDTMNRHGQACTLITNMRKHREGYLYPLPTHGRL